jgi:hypothetical protein
LIIHEIALVVDYLAYPNLCYLDAAGQARAGVAVEDCVSADAVAASFEESVFFGVEAEAVRQADGTFCGVVAARTWGTLMLAGVL